MNTSVLVQLEAVTVSSLPTAKEPSAEVHSHFVCLFLTSVFIFTCLINFIMLGLLSSFDTPSPAGQGH